MPRAAFHDARRVPRRRALMLLPLWLSALLPTVVAANATGDDAPSELAGELPQARPRGRGRLHFLGLPVYEARVWSAQPVVDDGATQPLAIEVRYARELSGERIARRSIDEMKRIGPFDDEQAERWLQAMTRLFPDVRAGDRLTGVQRPGQAARFYFNGRWRGEVADAEFTRLFFGIWLSPRTSEPALRAQLIGLAR